MGAGQVARTPVGDVVAEEAAAGGGSVARHRRRGHGTNRRDRRLRGHVGADGRKGHRRGRGYQSKGERRSSAMEEATGRPRGRGRGRGRGSRDRCRERVAGYVASRDKASSAHERGSGSHRRELRGGTTTMGRVAADEAAGRGRGSWRSRDGRGGRRLSVRGHAGRPRGDAVVEAAAPDGPRRTSMTWTWPRTTLRPPLTFSACFGFRKKFRLFLAVSLRRTRNNISNVDLALSIDVGPCHPPRGSGQCTGAKYTHRVAHPCYNSART